MLNSDIIIIIIIIINVIAVIVINVFIVVLICIETKRTGPAWGPVQCARFLKLGSPVASGALRRAAGQPWLSLP